jgi:hypothetical protein
MGKTYAEIDVTLVKITEGAFIVDTGDDEVGIPRSLIDEDESEIDEVGDTGVLLVEEWFAVQEGLV